MSTGNDHLRIELSARFQPPVDVLLDPSLLVASRSLSQLSGSNIFDSQTQATLGQVPTEPRLGELRIPATFRSMLESQEQLDIQKTAAWNYYRGQAEGSFREDIIDILNHHGVSKFGIDSQPVDLELEDQSGDHTRHEQLLEILNEQYAFLQSDGVMVSRTPRSLETFRDSSVPTIDLGQADLEAEVRQTLADIGYENPASICAFAVADVGLTTDALIGDVLSSHSDLLLYQVGT